MSAMHQSVRIALLAAPLLLGACAGLSDSDRALLLQANQNAEEAKREASRAADIARQALDAAKGAQSEANASAQAAQAASVNAKQANEKADRMFQRNLRK
jgi:hypothetical protein